MGGKEVITVVGSREWFGWNREELAESEALNMEEAAAVSVVVSSFFDLYSAV